MLLKQMVPGDK